MVFMILFIHSKFVIEVHAVAFESTPEATARTFKRCAIGYSADTKQALQATARIHKRC
jgi:hypothetical protein